MFIKNKSNYDLDYKGINTIRGLAIDMIDNASSGHPGICLGAASIIYTLYKRHMNISLENLDYYNRDRFVFSAGHGAPLLYSILYLLDILTIDDLKKLRCINSKTPGHPEYLKTPLVDSSTGPLGQGIGNAVGMAISSKHLNKITNGLINYYTYVLCGDGELEEGITYEALTLAGTLKLNNLIVLVDYNDTTLDNKLNISSCENLVKRFESINFNVIETNDDPSNIDEAIINAKNSDLPSVIIVKTIIGAYSKNEGKNIVHGKILDEEDILNVKEKLGLHKTPFIINQDVKNNFYDFVFKRGKENYKIWLKKYEKSVYKDLIDKLINKDNTFDLNNINIEYNEKSLRDLSSDILNYISNDFPLLIGGSADLSSSCKTNLDKYGSFNESYINKNIYFGIREHAMGSIINGIALTGLRPFGSTFLSFSDYLRPSIRMSAMMNLPVLYIFTHDSFTVGEDGPTHHPIEQIPSLELIPNLKIYRPFDLNELIGCYIEIFKNNKPSCLILPRDNKKISSETKTNGVYEGIYTVRDTNMDNYINLIGNGEELGIILEVSDALKEIGIYSKVLSVPCFKNIKKKDIDNLNKEKTIAITFTSPDYFYNITRDVIGMDRFSLSGKKDELLDYFSYTKEKLVNKILKILNKE